MRKLSALSLLTAALILHSLRATFAEKTAVTPKPVNSAEAKECEEVCGCDRIYIFDYSKLECVLNYEYLKERTQTKNSMTEDEILDSSEKVFRGIICSALFIVICASVCLISVSIYCCHIHISDEKLSNEVKDLAKKLNVDYHQKQPTRKKSRDQKEESCNVVVEDANIMCV